MFKEFRQVRIKIVYYRQIVSTVVVGTLIGMLLESFVSFYLLKKVWYRLLCRASVDSMKAFAADYEEYSTFIVRSISKGRNLVPTMRSKLSNLRVVLRSLKIRVWDVVLEMNSITLHGPLQGDFVQIPQSYRLAGVLPYQIQLGRRLLTTAWEIRCRTFARVVTEALAHLLCPWRFRFVVFVLPDYAYCSVRMGTGFELYRTIFPVVSNVPFISFSTNDMWRRTETARLLTIEQMASRPCSQNRTCVMIARRPRHWHWSHRLVVHCCSVVEMAAI